MRGAAGPFASHQDVEADTRTAEGPVSQTPLVLLAYPFPVCALTMADATQAHKSATTKWH